MDQPAETPPTTTTHRLFGDFARAARLRRQRGRMASWRRIFVLCVMLSWIGGLVRPLTGGEPPVAPGEAPVRAESSTASDNWFVSRSGGFKLQFPRGWFFNAGPAPADCTGYAPNDMYKKTPFTSFAVVTRALSHPDLPPGDQVTEMLKLGQEALKASLPGYKWSDAGDLKLTTGTGKYLIYSYQSENQALTGVVYYLILGRRQFVCHGRTLTDHLETARPIFDAVARSIVLNGEPQPAWVADKESYHNADLGCRLTLPTGFRPEPIGTMTVFRAAASGAEASAPPAPLSFSQELLPAPLQWVVYVETVKRQLRDRLLDYRPGTVMDFNYLQGQDAAAVEPDDAREFFEYTHQLNGKTMKVGSLFWLRGRQVLALTVSAPEADYPAVKENLFMPTANSWTWEPPKENGEE